MNEHRPTVSTDSESERGEETALSKGMANQKPRPSKLGNFDIRLKAVTADLQVGGPELKFALLVDYIDGVLDPDAMQQVGRNIVTWKTWYDAYWETLGADESGREANV